MEKINIAELLKDCPKGMELYSPLCGECKLYDVNDYNIRIETSNKDALICLYHDGRYCANGEIMLFPKGKTTWEGFQRPFKDGDILINGLEDYEYNPFIFKQTNGLGNAQCYCAINCFEELILNSDNWTPIKGCRLATEEEKAKLFKAIKDNGYKWNAETKILEKILKIKSGDIIYTETHISKWISIFEKFDDDECKCYIDYCVDSDTYCGKIGGKKNPLCDIDEIVEQRLATEEEKQKLFDVIKEHGHRWNSEIKTLVKLVQPKFKIGNVIQDIDAYRVKITEVNIEDECYEYESIFAKGIGSIPFSEQDNWKLVPDVKPIFKVGDNITKIDGSRKGEIFYIDVDKYHVAVSNDIGIDVFFEDQDDWELVFDIEPKFKVGDRIVKKDNPTECWYVQGVNTNCNLDYFYYIVAKGKIANLHFKEQDDYELVPNKFDITTLKPFQKVLVRDSVNLSRDSDKEYWSINLFGFYNEITKQYCCMGNTDIGWDECIPYEGNEHLLGTTDDCNDFYKTWE